MSRARVVLAWMLGLVLAVAVVLLEIAVVLSTTVLDPAFVSSELAGVELHPLIAERARESFPPELALFADTVDEVAPDLESWAHEQLPAGVQASTSYLRGEQGFRVVVSMEEPKRVLGVAIEEQLRNAEAAEMLGIPPARVQAIVAFVLQQLDNLGPDTLVIDETFLDAQTLGLLQQARRYVSYLELSLKVLPIVCILSLLLIAALCSWRLKLAARYVGVALCVAGLAMLATAGLAPVYLPRAVPDGIPSQFVGFVPGFVADCCRPLFVYATATLAAGAVVLLAVLGQERRRRAGG